MSKSPHTPATAPVGTFGAPAQWPNAAAPGQPTPQGGPAQNPPGFADTSQAQPQPGAIIPEVDAKRPYDAGNPGQFDPEKVRLDRERDPHRRRLTATHPQNTEPTRTYRILRGQYTRREFAQGDKKGTHVHYVAGSRDKLEMTDAEADKFGRRFLVEVTGGGLEKPTAEQTAYVESQAKVARRKALKGQDA